MALPRMYWNDQEWETFEGNFKALIQESPKRSVWGAIPLAQEGMERKRNTASVHTSTQFQRLLEETLLPKTEVEVATEPSATLTKAMYFDASQESTLLADAFLENYEALIRAGVAKINASLMRDVFSGSLNEDFTTASSGIEVSAVETKADVVEVKASEATGQANTMALPRKRVIVIGAHPDEITRIKNGFGGKFYLTFVPDNKRRTQQIYTSVPGADAVMKLHGGHSCTDHAVFKHHPHFRMCSTPVEVRDFLNSL